MRERLPMQLPIGEYTDSFNGHELRSVQLRREREKLFPNERRNCQPPSEPEVKIKRAYHKQNAPRSKTGDYDKILAEKGDKIIEDFRNGSSGKSLQIKYEIRSKKLYHYLKATLKNEYFTITREQHVARSSKNQSIQLR